MEKYVKNTFFGVLAFCRNKIQIDEEQVGSINDRRINNISTVILTR